MSLAKATFSGKVFREPQKRSTSNNVPITYFTFDIGAEGEEGLIRVRALGNMAEIVEKSVAKNDKLVVEGNLMLTSIKDETGAEKRIVELSLLSFEKIADTVSSVVATANDNIVKFNDESFDNLIDSEEIPF